MNEQIVAFRKKYNQIVAEAKRNAKQEKCLFCQKRITQFCKSHSVPAFVLRNIDENGNVNNFNDFVCIPFVDKSNGKGEAGTFRLICRECDARIFKDYEDPEKIANEPSERMLEEIALKNMLFMLNKRYFQQEQFKILKGLGNHMHKGILEKREEVNSIDIRDFEIDYARIKAMLENDSPQTGFKLFYWKKLPYKIPIAYQGMITIFGDLEGNVVADIYNKDPNVVMPHIHVVAFPLESVSVLMMFYHEEDHEYDIFAEQFSRQNDEEQLAILSFLILKYSEDFLIAPRFPHRTYCINQLRGVAADMGEIYEFNTEYFRNKQLKALKERDKGLPNLLSQRYSVSIETNV